MSQNNYDDFDLAGAYQQYGKSLVPQVIPEGPYEFRVKKAQTLRTKPKPGFPNGKPGLMLVHEVISGPYAGESLTDRQYLSIDNDTSVRIWNQTLTILGASEAWIISTGAKLAQVAARVVGTTFRANVKHEEYNGAKQARISSYTNTISGPENPVPGGQAPVTLDATPAPAQLPPQAPAPQPQPAQQVASAAVPEQVPAALQPPVQQQAAPAQSPDPWAVGGGTPDPTTGGWPSVG